MIKIKYEQEPYNYGYGSSQEYKTNTEITLNEDISSTDAIIAFMKVLNIATYNVTIGTLKNAINQLEDIGYEENDRIM